MAKVRRLLSGSDQSWCMDGSWSSRPVCTGENANCGPAPVVQYGETIQDRKPIHPHGTVMTYQCPDYYLPTGNKDVKCKNGKWDEPPVCIEPCTITKEGMAENNLALRWEYKDKLYAKHEEWIEFVCLTGYEDISQSLRIQCNRSVVPYPKCFKKGACIVSPIEMERNNISAIGGTEYESGKTVTFQCIEGFIPEKELTSVCKNKKINYPTCINANPCEISTVKLSENNLQLNLTDEPTKTTFAHNENIKFMCKSGFQFSKETTFTKCNNGIINYPQCIQGVKRCGPHDKIANGRIVSNAKINSFSSGDSLDIECDNTFEPTSSPTITCENGQWTIAPECVKKCGPPPAIENGRTQSEDKISFDLGSSLDIECNVNFVPNGSSSIICEKGEWINIPKCVRPCQISSEQLKKNNLILKSPDGLNEKYKPGEKIDVQCETDYFPEENDVLQAQCINGRITFPKCFLGKSCRITKNELEQNKLDLQQNGREEYEHNYLILFKCKQDFQTDASRQMRIKCNNGIIKYPRCFSKDFCKLSQENLDANNLQLGQDQDPEVSYDNNEKIKFECKPGFSINSGTTGICLNKIITYPRCFRIDESPV
ncbi:hypothetical protein GDO86_018682 [Hymenochirus boettgeri]|uniref:Sushi domain-containing protein n=1 Tax=Hymenochirus boettgeri TaxID=247094 RepID=A0A8T2IHJ2_9PIPI|nr:hypothetical protein GDO86_018682 [Hymenochirus boettgeri]